MHCAATHGKTVSMFFVQGNDELQFKEQENNSKLLAEEATGLNDTPHTNYEPKGQKQTFPAKRPP